MIDRLQADADLGPVGRGGLRDVQAWKGTDPDVDLAIASKFPHLMSPAELVALAAAEKERHRAAAEHAEAQRLMQQADREDRLADQARTAAEHEPDPDERAGRPPKQPSGTRSATGDARTGAPRTTAPNAAPPPPASYAPKASQATSSTPGSAPTSARPGRQRTPWRPGPRAVARRHARPATARFSPSARDWIGSERTVVIGLVALKAAGGDGLKR